MLSQFPILALGAQALHAHRHIDQVHEVLIFALMGIFRKRAFMLRIPVHLLCTLLPIHPPSRFFRGPPALGPHYETNARWHPLRTETRLIIHLNRQRPQKAGTCGENMDFFCTLFSKLFLTPPTASPHFYYMAISIIVLSDLRTVMF